jgi:hypothetical protein
MSNEAPKVDLATGEVIEGSVAHPSFEHSPSIAKLAEALAVASQSFTPAFKDTQNPAYRSKYAPLENLIDATREALSRVGLALLQLPSLWGTDVVVTTVLVHSSGEWISSSLQLPGTMRDRFDAQSVGSGITYARRYALQSILNIAGEVDDDGNAAAGIGSKEAAQAVAQRKIETYEEKTANQLSGKSVEYFESHLNGQDVIYFMPSPTLAIICDNGFADITIFDGIMQKRYAPFTEDTSRFIEEFGTKLGVKFVKVPGPQAPGKAATVATVGLPSPPSNGSSVGAQVPEASLPIIEGVSEIIIGTKNGKQWKRFNVKYKGELWSSFDVKLHPYLKAGIGKPALLDVAEDGKYRNLMGIRSIGETDFDEFNQPYLEQAKR